MGRYHECSCGIFKCYEAILFQGKGQGQISSDGRRMGSWIWLWFWCLRCGRFFWFQFNLSCLWSYDSNFTYELMSNSTWLQFICLVHYTIYKFITPAYKKIYWLKWLKGDLNTWRQLKVSEGQLKVSEEQTWSIWRTNLKVSEITWKYLN